MISEKLWANLREIIGEDLISADITDPDRIQRFYTRCLSEFGNVPKSNTLKCKEDADIMAATMPLLDLTAGLQYFFKRIECPLPFGLCDLIKPDTDRTEVFIRHYVNFWLFCNSHYTELENVKNDVLAKFKEQKSLEEKKKKLTKALEDAKGNKARSKAQEKNILPMIQELDGKIKVLLQEQQVLQQENLERKAAIDDMSSEIESLISKFEKLKALEMNQKLSQEGQEKVEKLKNTLSEKGEKRDAVILDMKRLEQSLSVLEILHPTLETVCKKVREVHSITTGAMKVSFDIEAERRNLDELNYRLKETTELIESLKLQCQVTTVKWAKTKQLKESEIEEYKGKVESSKNAQSKEEAIAKNYEEEITFVEHEINEIDMWRRSLEDETKQRYSDFLEKVKRCLNKITNDIKEITAANETLK